MFCVAVRTLDHHGYSNLAGEAAAAAGFPGFPPEAGLIIRYEPGAKLSLHQDRDERDLDQSIVSVPLSVDARFFCGAENRAATARGGSRCIMVTSSCGADRRG